MPDMPFWKRPGFDPWAGSGVRPWWLLRRTPQKP